MTDMPLHVEEAFMHFNIAQWLRWQHYVSVREAPLPWGLGGRIDVVGFDPNTDMLIGVEAKLQPTDEVLDQAERAKDYCEYVYVALPGHAGADFVRRVAAIGVGLLNVDARERRTKPPWGVDEQLAPKGCSPPHKQKLLEIVEEVAEFLQGKNPRCIFKRICIFRAPSGKCLLPQPTLELTSQGGWTCRSALTLAQAVKQAEIPRAVRDPEVSAALRVAAEHYPRVRKVLDNPYHDKLTKGWS